MNISLIANSGIQFWSTEVSFDPTMSADVQGIPLPPLDFTETLCLTDPNRNVLHVVHKDSKGSFYTLDELRESYCIKQELRPDGTMEDVLNKAGVPEVDWAKVNPQTMSAIPKNMCYSEYNVMGGFQLLDPKTNEHVDPFTKILGKWLPAPMFFSSANDESMVGSPSKWCRVRITEILPKGKNGNKYRLEWAFDTTLAKDNELQAGVETMRLPYFLNGETQKEFTLASHIGHLLSFLQNNEWVCDYMAMLIFGPNSLTNFTMNNQFVSRCRHMAYYISLFTQLRALKAYPSVMLCHNDSSADIPVDLVLDIGNSRTCGLLVENEKFEDAHLLNLRDLSQTYKEYKGSFDMHVAFHQAEFGEGNMGVETFRWMSFVRVGEEAKELISQSSPSQNLANIKTHHSSPKRYLWDDEKFADQWQYLQTEDINTVVQQNGVYLSGLSEQLNNDGSFIAGDRNKVAGMDVNSNLASSYSRRSLMTFVILEIIQQAICQINSFGYATFLGNRIYRRKLRNIIITCPTAMPEVEQIALRQCAVDAQIMLQRSADLLYVFMPYNAADWESTVSVIPKPIDIAPPLPGLVKSDWSYDEATCCQLVYLYSEIVDKYSGNAEKFIGNVGHIRKELISQGYDKKSLTIGSVDIGAGTTDIMICTYKYDKFGGGCRLTPVPLFWDSFYVAGDDILNEIVRMMILHNPQQKEHRVNYGPISSALFAKALQDELTPVDEDKKQILFDRAYAKVVDFFSKDANTLSAEDRRMRNDFNIQISIPIAQKMLDLMKNGETQLDLTYQQIFTEHKPSKHLLRYAKERFGIDIREMKWTYSSQKVTECIRTRMDRLLKQLSIILHAYNCDVVLLAGRPMSLEPLTDLFLQYFPVSPNRLVRMLPKNENAKTIQQLHNCYRVGRWFPSHDEVGYFTDLKPIVATGAYVGYLATHNKIAQMQIDMTEMKEKMCSTANYMGSYDPTLPILHQDQLSLTPDKSSAQLSTWHLPHYIVTKQINTEFYEARPIFALSLRPGVEIPSEYDMSEIKFTITRSFKTNKEELFLQHAIDKQGHDCKDYLQLKEQSLTMDENLNEYWLDNGAFRF